MTVTVTAAAADYRAESARDLASAVLTEFRTARRAQGDRTIVTAATRTAADHLDDLRVLCGELQEMHDNAPTREAEQAIAQALHAAQRAHARALRVQSRIIDLSTSLSNHPAGRRADTT